MRLPIAILCTGLLAAPAWGDLSLPPGFTAEVYVTGLGFQEGGERPARGIPAASTLGFDRAGALYLARTGSRFRTGDVDDLSAVYRIPPGGARLTAETEARYFFGPPFRNPQVAAVRGPSEVWVTTYDTDRKLGALYRMVDGHAALFAGGTPAPGAPPLLRPPAGVAVDAAGRVYVTDREQGTVIRLDAAGRLLDARYASVPRPRMLLFDEAGALWIGADGTAETPFQAGSGQIWRIGADGAPALVLEGPLPAAMSLSRAGALFVAQRRTGQVFVLTPEGKRIEFATATQGTILRGLAFAPVTPETQRAGIAGDLFVIAIPRQMWMINEVIRISGPFDDFVRTETRKPTP